MRKITLRSIKKQIDKKREKDINIDTISMNHNTWKYLNEKYYPHSQIVEFLDRIRMDIQGSDKFKLGSIDVDELGTIINKRLGGHFKFYKIL